MYVERLDKILVRQPRHVGEVKQLESMLRESTSTSQTVVAAAAPLAKRCVFNSLLQLRVNEDTLHLFNVPYMSNMPSLSNVSNLLQSFHHTVVH